MPEKDLSSFFRFAQRLIPLLVLAIFGIAAYFVHKLLKPFSYQDIAGYVRAIPRERFLASIGVTVLSYCLLATYDFLATIYVGKRISVLKVAFASFMAFAFSNTIGLANLAGSSVRMRMYPYFGLEGKDVVKMIAFISLSFWLGFLALAGFVLAVHPVDLPESYGLPSGLVRGVGILFLALVASYWGLTAWMKEPLSFRGASLKLPSFRLAFLQVLVAAGDWALAGLALFLLLPVTPGLGYFHFLSIFLTSQVVALLSHVPAGAGILEAMITQLLSPDNQSTPAIVGALIAYRIVYYLGPLLVAAVALGLFEIYRQRASVGKVSLTAFRFTSQLAPQMAAGLVFLAGAVLLISGASPAEAERMHMLRHLVSLSVVEISHFAGSVIGMALLVLSRSLLSRSKSAWAVTCVLLILGAIFSLVKGFDYEEALLLSFFLAFLVASHDEFHRKSPLLADHLSFTWILSILVVVGFATWLGFFTNKHVEYSEDLWWSFSFKGDASRFLRASFGIGMAAAFLAMLRLLTPHGKPKVLPNESLERFLPLIAASPHTSAQLALLGDKRIFTNEAHDAFLMYAQQGSTWVVLGDPVGNEDAFADLLYDFKETADSYGGAIVFYEVRPETLPLYIDLGMIFLKLGEEARVPLADFALDGRSRKSLRQQYNRTVKAYPLKFEILPAAEFDEILPALRVVSDTWLEEKSAREKGFSLGFFDPAYLKNFSTAVLRDENGVIEAFANVWLGANKEELSVDLMRYRSEKAQGTMERLLIDLMLWGKGEGYRWFNLGVAPLSGLETGRLGSRWNRAGRLMFQHGERFYNFQGLRAFKEKFHPDWEPRYLAYTGKLQLPKLLTDLAILISRGVKGVGDK